MLVVPSNVAVGLVVLVACSMGGCRSPGSSEMHADDPPLTSAVVMPASERPSDPEPVRTVQLPVVGDLAAVVVRGAKVHRSAMLFLPGMCAHPGGYVMSFQHTAAARGDLVAVQGDISCGADGANRRWSYDLDAMDRRIEAAFRAAGLGEPRDVIVIGYSQGAERAEKLVARWPTKYSAAVLIASPVVPSPSLLVRADAVALMAGTLDAQAPMRGAVEPLRRAGVPAAFFSIPGARHGQMGETPEDSMREALDFVEETRRLKKTPSPPSHGPPDAR